MRQLRNGDKSAIDITIIENKIEFKLCDILVAPIIFSMLFLKMLGKFNNSYKMVYIYMPKPSFELNIFLRSYTN